MHSYNVELVGEGKGLISQKFEFHRRIWHGILNIILTNFSCRRRGNHVGEIIAVSICIAREGENTMEETLVVSNCLVGEGENLVGKIKSGGFLSYFHT